MSCKALVAGAGGFIGHHLARYLADGGYTVRGADIKSPAFEPTAAHEFQLLDLRQFDNCLIATRGIDEVYHLAADMGGIGYITASHAAIMRNNTLISANMLEAARLNGVKRFLFSSSACVYPQYLQRTPDTAPLQENNAWPADPEEGYGLEKLYTEKLCQYYREDFAVPGEAIEVWGDGNQTRSFLFIDDCLEGIQRLMRSAYPHPLNLGNEEMATVNELVDLASEIAGKPVRKRHDLSKPQGDRGRNSDNTRLRQVLNWEPSTTLRQGLPPVYLWIEGELRKSGRLSHLDSLKTVPASGDWLSPVATDTPAQ